MSEDIKKKDEEIVVSEIKKIREFQEKNEGKVSELQTRIDAIAKDSEDRSEEAKKNWFNLDAEIKKLNLGSTKAEKSVEREIELWEKSLRFKGLSVMEDNRAMKFNFSDVEKKEVKAYRSDVDNALGYWTAVPAFLNEKIDTAVREFDPVAGLARVIRTSKPSVQITTTSAHGVAKRVKEGGTTSADSTLKAGLETLGAHKATALYQATVEMIADSDSNLAQDLMNEYGPAFALLRGQEYITGSGVGECEGIITAGPGTVNSGHATLITADGIKKLWYEPKSLYAMRGSFLARRSSFLAMSILTDGSGAYLLEDLKNGGGFKLMGAPLYESPTVPAIAASAQPLIFGDFRHYGIHESTALDNFIVDPYTNKATGIVDYMMTKGDDGQVLNLEAFKTLTISA